METTFFQDTFGVALDSDFPIAANDPKLHMVVYLQVAIISQALIFVTRSHSFFFMERPSTALIVAFCIAQLISSIIAAYGNMGFTHIKAISGGWIGIVWVWVSTNYFFCDICLTLSLLLLLEHHLVHPSRLD